MSPYNTTELLRARHLTRQPSPGNTILIFFPRGSGELSNAELPPPNLTATSVLGPHSQGSDEHNAGIELLLSAFYMQSFI